MLLFFIETIAIAAVVTACVWHRPTRPGLICRGCSYSLSGLRARDTRCPECGRSSGGLAAREQSSRRSLCIPIVLLSVLLANASLRRALIVDQLWWITLSLVDQPRIERRAILLASESRLTWIDRVLLYPSVASSLATEASPTPSTGFGLDMAVLDRPMSRLFRTQLVRIADSDGLSSGYAAASVLLREWPAETTLDVESGRYLWSVAFVSAFVDQYDSQDVSDHQLLASAIGQLGMSGRGDLETGSNFTTTSGPDAPDRLRRLDQLLLNAPSNMLIEELMHERGIEAIR
jgi:hypothetical protein